MGRHRLLQGEDDWYSFSRRTPAPPKPSYGNCARRNPKPSSIRRIFPIPKPFIEPPLSNPLFPPTTTSFPAPISTPGITLLSPIPAPKTSSNLTLSLNPNPLSDPLPLKCPPMKSVTPAGSDWYNTDPATKEAYKRDPFLTKEPSKKGWFNRCFKCLVCGHTSAACNAPVRACARCLRPDHGHSSCPIATK